MKGDIIRSIRINPRTQLAIDNLLKRHDYKGLTINKLISKVLVNLDSKEGVDKVELEKHFEARGRYISTLERNIKKIATSRWGLMSIDEKKFYDNSLTIYIGELYGVW